MSNALTPISEPFPDDLGKAMNKYPRINGYLLTLFRTFANSKRFVERGVPNLLDEYSPLPIKTRELIILRVTANNDCEYEWGVHVSIFSERSGLSYGQIEATAKYKIDPTIWSDEENTLLQVVDSLCARGNVEQNLLHKFQSNWSKEQQLEIIALCGTYHTVSFVANIAELSKEKFAPSFPHNRHQ